MAPSLIANAKVLYARFEEDLKKLNALQERIKEVQKPENKRATMKEAEEVYKVIPFYFEKSLPCRLKRMMSLRLGRPH